MSVFHRIVPISRQSFFLFGPRGVGKSTWARAAFPDAALVDLLDERLYQDLLADPSLFAASLGHLAANDWVVVDEVQRLPALLNEVHRLIELRRLRFALLGSSARKLKMAGVNLLAGRALKRTMHPLTPAELGDEFDLARVLRHGSLPLVWASDDPAAVLDAYAQLYLREEIRAEGLVRNLPGFARFLTVAAVMNGQVVNMAGVARDSGVARATVQGFLDILEETLLTFRLPAFDAKLRVRERKLPKLYWVDPGIVRAVKRQLGEVGPEERGGLFECWVLALLRAHGEQHALFDGIYYWAPHRSGVEVDFLLQRGQETLAIEVKSTDRYHTDHLKGLRAIAELPGLARRVLVYAGHRSFRTEDGIDVWPAGQLAAAAAEDRLWP